MMAGPLFVKLPMPFWIFDISVAVPGFVGLFRKIEKNSSNPFLLIHMRVFLRLSWMPFRGSPYSRNWMLEAAYIPSLYTQEIVLEGECSCYFD
jgi:hypothetical protein